MSDDFRLVGVLHLLPLPASPAPSPGLQAVIDRALHDAEALVSGGIGECIIENIGDAPFVPGPVDPHVPAMMTAVALAVRARFGEALALGVNILRNDAQAALAVAMACGARFVRVNVHIGSAWTDQGLIEGRAHHTLRYRRELGGEPGVQIVADVLVKHAVPAGQDSLEQVALEVAERGRADVLVVSGTRTGAATDLQQVTRVRAVVPARPIWVGSGVTAQTLPQTCAAADGAIVGTDLHRDRQLAAPLERERVRRLVGARTR